MYKIIPIFIFLLSAIFWKESRAEFKVKLESIKTSVKVEYVPRIAILENGFNSTHMTDQHIKIIKEFSLNEAFFSSLPDDIANYEDWKLALQIPSPYPYGNHGFNSFALNTWESREQGLEQNLPLLLNLQLRPRKESAKIPEIIKTLCKMGTRIFSISAGWNKKDVSNVLWNSLQSITSECSNSLFVFATPNQEQIKLGLTQLPVDYYSENQVQWPQNIGWKKQAQNNVLGIVNVGKDKLIKAAFNPEISLVYCVNCSSSSRATPRISRVLAHIDQITEFKLKPEELVQRFISQLQNDSLIDFDSTTQSKRYYELPVIDWDFELTDFY